MNNGTMKEVVSQFDIISKLEDVWDHNQHYQKYFLSKLDNCDTALDIGCGTGEFTREISKYAKRVTGIDISQEMINKATTRTSNLKIKYICVDLDTYFTNNNEKYDLIVCIAALHHMNEEVALGKIKQKLNNGGMICVLDLYQNETIFDYVLSILASILNPIMMLIHRGRISITKEEREAWKEHFQYDNYKTIKEIKKLVKKNLGNAKVRQHLFWRYSVVYTKEKD